MNWAIIQSMATVGGTILTLIVAYSAFKQLKINAKNSKGDFILNLQRLYAENSSYAALFEACWHNYNGEMSDAELREYLLAHEKDVLNYLTFFETVYLMLEHDVLEVEFLDGLFGRRFFVVVNNPIVQEVDLLPNRTPYENVYRLYKKWKRYREKTCSDVDVDLFINQKNKRYKDLLQAYDEWESAESDA